MDRPHPGAPPDGWTVDHVTRDGVDVARYHRPGDGPPLVGVHGLTSWGPDLFDLLAAVGDFDRHCTDIRGHGRSEAPAAGYDLDTAAADLAAVLDDAGVADPALLGHSLGGGVVTTYAARHGARAVVLLDPVGFLYVDADEEDDADDGAWITENIERARADPDVDDAGAAFASERVRGFLGRDADPSERYPDVDAPVLVLRADVPPAQRRRDEDVRALLDDVTVEYVSDAGHCPHRDRPERTAALVRSFLDRHA